ncbi:MAG: hypothetical protein JOZ90_14030 [Alphaproteobacteria bacterium]|nr:hypothetical protein [Alphaproteobacteria bacterium]MBV9371581.1 hypothetical protein [Alphaproteobacteria bacterium]MBV9902190.1 hypothetical protein [Alphaproteobacteria bacterium]
MRRLVLLPFLLLAACGDEAPAPKQRAGPVATRTVGPPAPPAPRPSGSRAEGAAGAAAETLRRYYAAIGAADFGAAWRMRTSNDGLTPERFAANFKAYESYEASVGEPSLPVRAGDWDFVEVPVMITGRMRGGKPFGTSGSVTLRRAHDGPDRGWRVFTG